MLSKDMIDDLDDFRKKIKEDIIWFVNKHVDEHFTAMMNHAKKHLREIDT